MGFDGVPGLPSTCWLPVCGKPSPVMSPRGQESIKRFMKLPVAFQPQGTTAGLGTRWFGRPPRTPAGQNTLPRVSSLKTDPLVSEIRCCRQRTGGGRGWAPAPQLAPDVDSNRSGRAPVCRKPYFVRGHKLDCRRASKLLILREDCNIFPKWLLAEGLPEIHQTRIGKNRLVE